MTTRRAQFWMDCRTRPGRAKCTFSYAPEIVDDIPAGGVTFYVALNPEDVAAIGSAPDAEIRIGKLRVKLSDHDRGQIAALASYVEAAGESPNPAADPIKVISDIQRSPLND